MSHPRLGSETSGYSTSASDDFESFEDQFRLPSSATKSASKRRATEKVEDLNEMMEKSLHLSPVKRLCFHSENDANMKPKRAYDDDPRDSLKNGRPPTRRGLPTDVEHSPRVRALREPADNNSMSTLRSNNKSGYYTETVSPKLLSQYGGMIGSPRKRGPTTDNNGSIYQRHRLGQMFSPIVVGATRKQATPMRMTELNARQSPMNSPRQSILRTRGRGRGKGMIGDRFN